MSGWGYGKWGGGSPDPWGGGETKLHYYALKKIFPIQDLQGTLDDDLTIEGKYLDQVFYQDQNSLSTAIFPDGATTGDLLGDWDRIFSLPATGTDAEQQGAVIAAEQALINKNGKLNPAYFIQMGVDLGYTDVTIHEGLGDQFICATAPDESHLPHAVYTYSWSWTWTITSAMIPAGLARTQWEDMVTKAAPAFTKIIFQYS